MEQIFRQEALIVTFMIRTALEDRTLQAELPGHRACSIGCDTA